MKMLKAIFIFTASGIILNEIIFLQNHFTNIFIIFVVGIHNTVNVYCEYEGSIINLPETAFPHGVAWESLPAMEGIVLMILRTLH